MFDIGFWELAVIGIVALLVIGPERMPAVLRTAGQWMGQFQRLARDLRREIERETQSDEFRALNQEFLAEDRRLKESVRQAASKDPADGSGTAPAQTAQLDDVPAPPAGVADASRGEESGDDACAPRGAETPHGPSGGAAREQQSGGLGHS